MLFSSIVFIFYFLPVVLLGSILTSPSRPAQNFWLLVTSLVFYAWGEPVFVFFMLLSIVVNWACGLVIDACRGRRAVLWAALIFAVLFNLGVLFVYKYADFIIGNINFLLGRDLIARVHLGLPLGISFFTFQALSYIIDIYRGDTTVEKNPLYVGLYIALFPALVAGPILQYSDIAGQIRHRQWSWGGFSEGCCRFVVGLGKKVLIANSVGIISDRIFELSSSGNHVVLVPAMLAWIGILAYTIQIYYDFSGYSDMALGLGKMFGFTFRENFNYPYSAGSMLDFWRRWHISLTSWFRSYVYFPLGGSRPQPGSDGEPRSHLVRNLFIVWLLTGIWHGANWTFILWGMWHFAMTLWERVARFNDREIPRLVRHIYVLLAVMIGWVFFRALSVQDALNFLANMFMLNDNGFYSDLSVLILRENWLVLFLGLFFSFPVAREFSEMLREKAMASAGKVFSAAYPVALLCLFAVSVVYLAKGGYTPFIYFNF